ncbi:MAG: cytochrome c biogenesis protein CcdA [Actinomycetaceae bacterium]|nr:cytochrome c biogenesis protein CcdA [Actinomycetaceae bacterium]
MDVTLPLAFLAGVVTFASPCFLPIVPVFVGQLVGGGRKENPKRTAGLNAVMFILGFTFVFMGIWLSLGIIGNVVGRYTNLLRIAGGVVLILMGLHVAKLISIPFLDNYVRGDMQAPSRISNGSARSLLMGIVFGAGWTPCIGPILGGILALAMQSETMLQGGLFMLVFSLGLGIPIILVAVGAVDAHARFAFFTRHQGAIELITGALLMIIGFLMITNLFAVLNNIFPALL